MKIIEYFKKRKQKKLEKIAKRSKLNRFIRGTVGFILYVVLVVMLVWGTPKALSYYLKTDYPMAAITSGSMWPELKKGDLIFIEGLDNPRNVQIGDIIVYLNEKDAFTIHRVIKLEEETLTTKGDANNVEDKPIRYKDIVGRLYKIGNRNARIPKLGFVSTTFSKFAQK